MLRRIIRIAPLALAGWRFFQSRQRRRQTQRPAQSTGAAPATTPPQSYR